MHEHYNLYYIFLEEKEANLMCEEVRRKIFKEIEKKIKPDREEKPLSDKKEK